MKITSSILCIIFLISCGEPKFETESIEVPSDLIAFDQMPQIVVDVNLTEAHLAELRLLGLLNKDSSQFHMNSAFAKNGVSKNQFQRSIEYFAHQKDGLDSIYDSAQQIILAMDNKLKDVHYKEEKLTQLNRNTVREILLNEKLSDLLNDSTKREEYKFKVIDRVRKDTSLLAGNPFRQFAFSYNLFLGSERKFKLFKDELLKSNRQ